MSRLTGGCSTSNPTRANAPSLPPDSPRRRSRRFPEDSNHAQLVRAVIRCWAEQRELFARHPEPTTEQIDFLRTFDLGYGDRRLRFVIAALRWWYRDLHSDDPDVPPEPDIPPR